MKFLFNGSNLICSNEELFFITEDLGSEKYYKFSQSDDILEIPKSEYLIAKYGVNYAQIQPYFYIGLEQCNSGKDEYDNMVVSFYQESVVRLFDKNKQIVWADDTHTLFLDTIYDVKLTDGFIWILYPTSDLLVSYSLEQQEISLKFTKKDGLNCPESLTVYEGKIYICNMGSNELLCLGNNLSPVMNFSEPIWEYAKTKNAEYVKLESGVYLI